jgi:hypothetical protein
MARRSLQVPMDELLDAAAGNGDGFSAWLDTETGAIEYRHDDAVLGEDDEELEPPRWQQVPQRESRDAFRDMERFADGVDDPDVRDLLAVALRGRGAFGRFREVLSRHPDLRGAWEREQRATLLREALEWLAELGIDPVYELRERPAPAAEAASPRRRAQITLTDLLLLGAPGGKTEILDGRTTRHWVAASPEQARAVYESLARELTEQAGIGWRNRFVDGRDTYPIGRHELSVDGTRVRLRTEVSREVRDEFRR